MIKQAIGFGVFHAIRFLDLVLPVAVLRWALFPWAALRALLPTPCLQPSREWPMCLGPDPGCHPRPWSQRVRHHLDRVPAFLPDRLGSPRWRERFEFTGIGPLEAARMAGQPVVLAFCHFGPIVLISHCLRARGIPATPLVAGEARNRPLIHRLKDRYLPFPEVPGALYLDQIREAAALGTTTALLVALDVRADRTVDVPLADGWQFRVATGAIRMAARKRALLVPCTVLSVGPWRFRIELGRPVPEAFLGPVPDVSRAATHLVSELFPLQKAYSDHWCRELLESLRKPTSSMSGLDAPAAAGGEGRPDTAPSVAVAGTRTSILPTASTHR